jgi:hypothetical protein
MNADEAKLHATVSAELAILGTESAEIRRSGTLLYEAKLHEGEAR